MTKTLSKGGETALLALAVDADDVFTVRMMLDRGGDPNAPTIVDGRPTHLLLCARSVSVVNALLDGGASWEKIFDMPVADEHDDRSGYIHRLLTRSKGRLGLQDSCFAMLEVALRRGYPADGFKDDPGYPHLMWVGDVQTAELFLRHGADVNARAADGRTPLFAACCERNLDVARLLLEHGADPSAVSEDGETIFDALHYARGDVERVRALLQNHVIAASLGSNAGRGGSKAKKKVI